jgi:putative FmdB family regulatory protein
MPTYEYECERCGNRFEKFQSLSESSLKKCPQCQGSVHRLISGGGGLIIKDSGSGEARLRAGHDAHTRCGKEQTCCGKDDPCERPPCSE